MYRKCLPCDRFSLPLVLKSGAGCVRKPPQLLGPPHGGGNISDEVTVASSSSQPPALHTPRQTAPWPDRRRCREKKMVQGHETHDWPTWESFSQPHSVPRRARTRKDHSSVSVAATATAQGTDVVFECTPDGESPSFTCQSGAVTLIARSAVYDMRLCAWETHSCPTVPTSPVNEAWT